MKYNVSFDIDFLRNEYPGTFVVLEGIDASGKTTQAHRLTEALKSGEKEVIATHEPTKGVIGTLIREILAGKTQIPLVGFQYLFVADRVAHQEEIKKHLEQGALVISDRYFWSAIAYGLADKEEVDFDNTAHLLLTSQSMLSMYHQFILPDYTFFLNVGVDESVKRLSSMDKEKELYEKRDKLERISKGYGWLISQFKDEFTVIDGTKSEEEITSEIIGSIK